MGAMWNIESIEVKIATVVLIYRKVIYELNLIFQGLGEMYKG